MPSRRPIKPDALKSGAVDDRHKKSFHQYRRLYPSLPERVSAVLKSEIPFVRQRLDALRVLAGRRSDDQQVWFTRKYNLTPMESKIAVFVAEGGSVAEFAKAHRKAPATVRSHLKAIFRKTGASRQADLPALLMRHGMF